MAETGGLLSRYSFGSILGIALLVAGCSDRAQEMEEQITQMQRQLDQAQKELQAAKETLASRPTGDSSSTNVAASGGGKPSRESLEASYAAGVSEFRKKLDASLKDIRVESCTTHSVQMPTDLYPFTSQLSFVFSSPAGKNFTTDIPVKADMAGNWIFPSVTEVAERIGGAERMASAGVPPVSDAPSRGTAAKSQPASTPTAYMPVDGTIVIQWPDAARSAAPATSTAAAPAATSGSTALPVAAVATPPARPQPSQAPSAPPVMPVDRDVKIQFPSPP